MSVNKKVNQVLSSSFKNLGHMSSNDKFNRTQTNSLVNISEFKRLKELSDAIRGIDNIIYEQNIKKESLSHK